MICKGKRFLIFMVVLGLLLYPVAAFACSSGRGAGTTPGYDNFAPGEPMPQSSYIGRTVVRSDGMKRLTVYYHYSLKPVPGTPSKLPSQPSQPGTPPPGAEPPLTPPPAAAPPVITPPPAAVPEVLTAEERQMWELVNAERTSRGLKALEIHPGLVKLARLKSQDMITHNYFAHQSPSYGSPFEMMQKEGIGYRFAGENLAGASTVERAHQALMNSPGHRANILNPNYTHIGIGIVSGGPYGQMFTQMFIGI